MSKARRDRARQEAAHWFTRLRRRAVTTQEIRDFREWRRTAQNRAALAAVEDVWDQAGRLEPDTSIDALRRDVLRRTAPRGRSRPPRPWMIAAGAAALVLACASLIVGYRWLFPSYDTGVGEQRIVRLSDGSTLRLNTDSRAVVKFNSRQRSVELVRGEALFDVAHDAARAFRVRAGPAEVRAIGTVFDVRLAQGGAEVTLLKGSVQVRGTDGGVSVLRPNQRVQIHRHGILKSNEPTDAARATSWTERRLTFDSTPLGDAIAEVNRYSANQIELAAADLAGAPVNGVFETGDTEAFASAVSSVFDLQLTHRGSDIVLQRAAGVQKKPVAR
jgi:transmembrane sensor